MSVGANTKCRPEIGRLADAVARGESQNVIRMASTKTKQAKRTKTGNKSRTEPPWNVILYNDWDNSMPRVILVLKKIIPGMTIKKAAKIMYEAHSKGQAVVKSCHKELAELYEERLYKAGLSVSIEPTD